MPTCPICKNKNTEFFHTLNHFSYFRCDNCTTLFLHPQPTKKGIDEYYKKNFVYSAGESNEANIRRRARMILSKLKSLNPDGNRLLDIGSGYGFFLDEAQKSGFHIYGIEPSKELINVSINRLIGTIVNMSFDEYYSKNKKRRFDFISLIHVIEHVNNPKETIMKALSLLNKNGVLYIETPNIDSHLFRAEKYGYTFLTPPDHIWLFSFASFDHMMKNTKGIEILQKTTYSQPEHFMGILKKKLDVRSGKLDNEVRNEKNLTSKFNNPASNLPHQTSYMSKLKFVFFDRLLAPLFTPLLNIGRYGSILELYIKKK